MSSHSVRVVNQSRDLVLAERAERADTIWRRFCGLMGKESLPPGGGLVLEPGGAIHMFFMRMPLDILHVDCEDRVTHVLRGLRPWRMGPLRVGNAFTVELPVGAAGPTQPGDVIALEDA